MPCCFRVRNRPQKTSIASIIALGGVGSFVSYLLQQSSSAWPLSGIMLSHLATSHNQPAIHQVELANKFRESFLTFEKGPSRKNLRIYLDETLDHLSRNSVDISPLALLTARHMATRLRGGAALEPGWSRELFRVCFLLLVVCMA